jgi:hypothetical protein
LEANQTMIKTLVSINLGLILILTSCTVSRKSVSVDEFSMDFARANVQLRGELKRYSIYKDDLSTLTYEEYLKFLKGVEGKSTKNITMIVKKADPHYFIARQNTFLIVIYCKELNLLIFDDANTAFCDSTLIITDKANRPDLKSLIR